MAGKGLRSWVNKLSKVELPVLAGVIRELNELTGSDDADVNQLAEAILKDANLTSQVLRIANSVHYNPTGLPINTVSRAVVLIGFTGVRAICISCMVIDSLLGKQPRDRLLESMAKAFHSAVQSRNLIRKASDEDVKEEVFIASLLYHIGDMSFWACAGESADELDSLLQEDNMSAKEAMQEVLGTSFKSIARELANIWKLGDTLREALDPPKRQLSPKVVAVLIGEEISRNAAHGWNSPEMGDTFYKISRFTGLDFNNAKQMVLDAADEAASVALTFGASQVCHLIPSSQTKVREEADTHILKSDPQVQLNILRELSNAIQENLDVNTVFQMALEGLHRGIGLERVVVAFIQKNELFARYVLGEGTDTWREVFKFSIAPTEDNIFTYAINKREPIWLTSKDIDKLKHLYSTELIALLGKVPAFLSVVTIGSRDVALFYADRWNFGGVLKDSQFESFHHFVTQTQSSLELLANKQK